MDYFHYFQNQNGYLRNGRTFYMNNNTRISGNMNKYQIQFQPNKIINKSTVHQSGYQMNRKLENNYCYLKGLPTSIYTSTGLTTVDYINKNNNYQAYMRPQTIKEKNSNFQPNTIANPNFNKNLNNNKVNQVSIESKKPQDGDTKKKRTKDSKGGLKVTVTNVPQNRVPKNTVSTYKDTSKETKTKTIKKKSPLEKKTTMDDAQNKKTYLNNPTNIISNVLESTPIKTETQTENSELGTISNKKAATGKNFHDKKGKGKAKGKRGPEKKQLDLNLNKGTTTEQLRARTKIDSDIKADKNDKNIKSPCDNEINESIKLIKDIKDIKETTEIILNPENEISKDKVEKKVKSMGVTQKYEKNISDLITELNKKNSTTSEGAKKINKLQKQLDTQNKKVAELENKLKLLSNEKINELNQQLEEKIEFIKKIKEDNENIIKKKDEEINNLTEQLKKANSNIVIINKLNQEKKIKNQNNLKEISELKNQLKKANYKIKQLEEANKQKEGENINIQKLEEELLQKEKNYDLLNIDLNKRERNIKNAENAFNERMRFIEQTEYSLQSQKKKLENDKKNFELVVENLKNKKTDLENQINLKIQQLNNLNTNINNLMNMNNNNLMNMNIMNMNNNMNNMNMNMNNNMNNMNKINFNIPLMNNNMNNMNMNNINLNNNLNNINLNNNLNNQNFNNNNNNKNKNKNRPPKKGPLPMSSYPKPTLIGLQNIGATCFMNATLQCLSQTEDLTNYFLDEKRSSNKIKNNNIAIKNRNALQLTPVYLELVKQLWDKNSVRKYIEPKRFMKTVEEMNPLFKLGQAGDSKDFIIFLLEQFHTELKKSLINDNNQEETQMINQYDKNEAFNNFFDDFKKQISIISDIFFGVIETTNICLYCKNDYTNKRMPYPICYNYQIFNCLIFPLEEVKKYKNDLMKRNGVNIIQNNSVTLEECFYYNQKTDYFTGDNRNYCNICKQTYDSHYTSKIYSSPNVLVLILNRGKNNIFNVKLNFNEIIDITEFSTVKGGKLIYNLYGVITHYGESGPSAHFLAFCKSPIDNRWYRYNDAIVTEVKDLKKDVIDFGNPYILFYKKTN